MKVFEFDSVPESYPTLLEYVLRYGHEVSPRGMMTREITPATVVIHNPRKRVIDHPVRKLNYGFMVGELLWILQGKNDLSVAHYNRQWANFTDDGEILNGAYGQRIFNWDGGEGFFESDEMIGQLKSLEYREVRINQFAEVYRKLRDDRYSRQGTIVLFDPTKDFLPTKDVPCTNLMRFSIRDDRLNAMVVMRSNDLIRGYPYDTFNFTVLQELMAGLLGVEVGRYTHVIDSMHLYESDFDLAGSIVGTPYKTLYGSFEPLDLRLSEDDIDPTLSRVFDVEHVTRENGDTVGLDTVLGFLDRIGNDYWRSLTAVIAVYNLRKVKRDQVELDTLRKYVMNEFQFLIKGWNQISP